MKNISYDIPVLLLIWNRPNLLEKSLFVIEKIKPRKIFVACDGPRKNNIDDIKKIKKCKQLIKEKINWHCEIKEKYNNENMGCAKSVSNAITWFFKNVDYGIILEDDCFPHQLFFNFAETLLKKYINDKKIWSIGAINLQNGSIIGDGSYYLSIYNHCWGWATWKDRWDEYDHNLMNWDEFIKSNLLHGIFSSSEELNYWKKYINKVIKTGNPDSWAIRWFACCLMNGGLTILPNQSLVQNVGFGINSTNTRFNNSKSRENFNNIQFKIFEPIKHPKFLLRSKLADEYTFKNHYRISLIQKIRNKIYLLNKFVFSLF